MTLTREEKRKRWQALASKGKTHFVIVRGVLGFGVGLTIFTFFWEHITNFSTLALRQVSLDLLIRAPLCLIGGFVFGHLTWRWFCRRYAGSDGSVAGPSR
jgi:hypothetical protein